jgi:hypothetical protein
MLLCLGSELLEQCLQSGGVGIMKHEAGNVMKVSLQEDDC